MGFEETVFNSRLEPESPPTEGSVKFINCIQSRPINRPKIRNDLKCFVNDLKFPNDLWA